MNQTCERVRGQFALLIYGELSFDEEEAVESHIAGCLPCAEALGRERELLSVFDQVAVEPSPALLSHCREELVERLAREAPPTGSREGLREGAATWLERALDSFTIRVPVMRWAQPMGAVALLAIGFLSARFVPAGGTVSPMGLVDAPAAARVRYIEPSANGQIQIVLDETRQRTVTGTMADERIRQFLLDAARDPDTSVRQQTLKIWVQQASAVQSQREVRDALMWTMRNDMNATVRRQAMNGLKGFVREPEVRTALAEVLLNDEDQVMRSDAISLLLESVTNTETPMDRSVVEMLQRSMTREEENALTRQRVQNALELVNASVEIY